MSDIILDVKDLSMSFFTDQGELPAVNHVSFQVEKGKTLGIVGESGCGKSMTSLCVMRLFPSPPWKIVGGSIIFDGKDLTKLSKKEMRAVRGKEMHLFQITDLRSQPDIMRLPAFRHGIEHHFHDRFCRSDVVFEKPFPGHADCPVAI